MSGVNYVWKIVAEGVRYAESALTNEYVVIAPNITEALKCVRAGEGIAVVLVERQALVHSMHRAT